MEANQLDIILEEIRVALEGGRIDAAVAALLSLHPADRADAFADLDDEDQSALLPKLTVPFTADLLEELKDEEAADVAETMPPALLATILDEMEPDEAADVLGDLSPELASEALAEMAEAADVLPLLSHPDETAGGLMTTSYIAVHPDATAEETIEYLRRVDPDEEVPYYIYVIEANGHLAGVIGMRELLLAEPHTQVGSFMDPEVMYVTTDTDQEKVARQMVHYDLTAMPVVDQQKILRGVITHDDILDVLEEEATEDIYRLANVSDPDLSIDSPVHLSVRRRLPWLYLNTLTALFAAWVISNYEDLFAQVAVLAVFQSVVAGMGGNAATQTLAMIVRGMALGEVSVREAWKSLLRQIAAGLIQGVAVGAVIGIGVYIWRGSFALGLILFLALVGNMIVATTAGTLIPLLLRAMKQDPALASSVFVTAMTDSIGFALFLGLARVFLPQLR